MLNSTDEAIHLHPGQRIGLVETIATACPVARRARANSQSATPTRVGKNFNKKEAAKPLSDLEKMFCDVFLASAIH
jgi:hypothetical protein